MGAVNWRQHRGVRFLGSESVAFHAGGTVPTHKIENSPPAFPKQDSTPIAVRLGVCVNSKSLPSRLPIQNEKLPAWFSHGGNVWFFPWPRAEFPALCTVFSEKSIVNPKRFSTGLRAAGSSGLLDKNYLKCRNWEKENQSLRLNQQLDRLLEYI